MTTFPLSAMVGQHKMRLALILNAVDPLIGGVLICGRRGTGKSTAVRALTQLLPPITGVADCPYLCDPTTPQWMCAGCRTRYERQEMLPTAQHPVPLVTLPLNASEDRVAGSFDLAAALTDGVHSFAPGLLAAANRGFLYIDEINLLNDHIVDLLLDAAALGINRVERDAISIAHPARFVLVGTMNPEEGALRPQLLDRIGLYVEAEDLRNPQDRALVVERRLAYDASPETKRVLLALLQNAYEKRDRVAMLVFRFAQGRVVMPPTRNFARARRCVEELYIGGCTPLATGLLEGLRLAETERLRDPTTKPILIVLTDGLANVDLSGNMRHDTPRVMHSMLPRRSLCVGYL